VARKGQPARWGADAPVDIFAQMNRQRLKPLHAVQGFFHMHFAPGFVVLRLHILSHFHFALGRHCVLTRRGRQLLAFVIMSAHVIDCMLSDDMLSELMLSPDIEPLGWAEAGAAANNIAVAATAMRVTFIPLFLWAPTSLIRFRMKAGSAHFIFICRSLSRDGFYTATSPSEATPKRTERM